MKIKIKNKHKMNENLLNVFIDCPMSMIIWEINKKKCGEHKLNYMITSPQSNLTTNINK